MKDIKDMNLEEVRQKIYEHALAISNDELYSLLDRLDELTRWIPVGERMPEEGERVLMLMNTGYRAVGYVLNGKWVICFGAKFAEDYGYTVTHWKRITPPEDV
jgi:hypothetical protein